MESKASNVDSFGSKADENNKAKTGLTPRELIYYHMNNPDEPISDEDMENLILITGVNTVPPDEK